MNHNTVHSVIEETIAYKERFPDNPSDYDVVEAISEIVGMEMPDYRDTMFHVIVETYDHGADAGYDALAYETGIDFRPSAS